MSAAGFEKIIRELVAQEVARQLAEIRPDAVALLTVEQAAERLGMSKSYVRARIREGVLPAQRVGRAVRVKPADVDGLSKRRKAAKVTPAARATEILAGIGCVK